MFCWFDKGCDFNQFSTTLDKIIPLLSTQTCAGGDTVGAILSRVLYVSRAHRKHDVTFSWLADTKIAARYLLFKNINVLPTDVRNVFRKPSK